jgi:ATP-binding protein involved in chromosome partitioning
MPLSNDQVIAILRTVNDPELDQDLVSLGMVKNVQVAGDTVHVHIELTTPACPLKAVIMRDVQQALQRIGARTVNVEFSASARTPAQGPRNILPQVKNVLAVGAGKGGVGKSTVAVNLAVGLHRQGAAVGLMDGDIYGPSMPAMLGIKGRLPQLSEGMLIPHFVHGIHAVTIGSLVEQDKPLIWRGPMAHAAFKQLFSDNTQWPALDYLIVDLPPGTGDVPLTLCQLRPLTGAVIVATPQQVALDDCIRAAHMFQQLNVPILGIVENMSYFLDPATGAEHDIFGRGGAEKTAQRLGMPFLGSIPMFPELRVNSDNGTPLANFHGNPKLTIALETIVANLAAQLTLRNLQPRSPQLNIV